MKPLEKPHPAALGWSTSPGDTLAFLRPNLRLLFSLLCGLLVAACALAFVLLGPGVLLPVLGGALFLYGLYAQRTVFVFCLFAAFLVPAMPLLQQSARDEVNFARWALLAASAYLGGLMLLVQPRKARPSRFHQLYLLVAGVATASALYSLQPAMSLAKGLALLALALVVSTLPWLLRIAPGTSLLESLRRGYVLSLEVVLVSVAVFWLYDPEASLSGQWLQGPFGNPNFLGMLLGVVGLPAFLGSCLAARTNGQRARFALGTLASAVFLVLSFSRAGLLAGTISASVVVLRRKVFLAWTLAAAALAWIVLTAGLSAPTPLTRVVVKYPGELPGETRLALWQRRLEQIQARPLLGTGFGTSYDAEEAWQFGFATAGADVGKGNSYLGILEELGLLGGLFAGLLLATLLARVLKFLWQARPAAAGSRGGQAREDRPEDFQLRIVAGIILGGLANATFEAWLFSPGNPVTVMFWLAASALIYAVPRTPTSVARQ